MRFSKVSRDGKYSTPPHAKVVYGTLVSGRADIVKGVSFYLAKIMCIAIRYSIVRRQGNNTVNNPNESKVLDYQFQQYRLFNGLSVVYAFRFVGKWIGDFSEISQKKLEKGDTSSMADIHAISAVRN